MCKDIFITSMKQFFVFDLNDAKLILSCSSSVIKPLAIKESNSKFLRPTKFELDNILNNPIIITFMALRIAYPSYNSTISCGSTGVICFKLGRTESEPIDVVMAKAPCCYGSMR
jgi:hypothetical protein